MYKKVQAQAWHRQAILSGAGLIFNTLYDVVVGGI